MNSHRLSGGYNEQLSEEWLDWVETNNGTRDAEMFPFIKEWILKTQPNSIADIGCGQGACSKLVKASQEYIGIDPSHTLISRAKKLHSSPNKRFLSGNAYDVPLSSSSIDAAISIWVWSHLEDLLQASKEMHRILRPNGYFLIITANPKTYEERKTFYEVYDIKDNLLRGTFELGEGRKLTDTTLYLHTTLQILTAIKDAGLIVVRTSTMGQAEKSDNGLYLVIEGKKEKMEAED